MTAPLLIAEAWVGFRPSHATYFANAPAHRSLRLNPRLTLTIATMRARWGAPVAIPTKATP